MGRPHYPYPPSRPLSAARQSWQLAEAVKSLREGGIASTGTITLAASTADTFTDVRIDALRAVWLTPTNALAANSRWWVTTGENQFIVNHTISSTGATFVYVVLGG